MDNNSNYGAMKFEYKVLWNSQMQKKKKNSFKNGFMKN